MLWLVLVTILALSLVLITWGILSRGPTTVDHPPGKPYPGRDGTWLASKGEQRIQAWLADHGIEHTYEPELAGGLRPDFHLAGTDVVIEYWGMAGHTGYEARLAEKLAQYEAHGYEVISLFPMQLRDLDEILEDELAERGITGT